MVCYDWSRMEPASQRVGDVVVPEHDERGVDVSLIRWMLSLSPLERLQILQNNLNAVARVREYQEGR